MSLKFNWRFFDVEDLQKRCQEAFTASIANTRRPPSIAEPIRATKIDFGTQPPQIAFRSVMEVGLARTRIVFSFKYAGDASITMETAIQANVLREPFNDPGFSPFTKPKTIGCLSGLVLPFRLTVKRIVIDTLIDAVYTPHGVLVYFRGEPIKELIIESSLDMIPKVNETIAKMMKAALADSFVEDIPESVWTSTSPSKQGPDPFYGARRWSRHTDKFSKFSTTICQPLGPLTGKVYPEFNTFALNGIVPAFSLPNGISSRASLPSERRVDRTLHRHEIIQQGFAVSADTSVASSHSSSSANSYSRKFKPKRRVISLRSPKEAHREAPALDIPDIPDIPDISEPPSYLLRTSSQVFSETADSDMPIFHIRSSSSPQSAEVQYSRIRNRTTSMPPKNLQSPLRYASTNDLK